MPELSKFNRYRIRLLAFLKASLSNVVSSDRRSRIRDGADCWTFLAESKLPTLYLSELWPAIGREAGHANVGITHPWELSYGESAVLDALVRYLRPRTIFEFGTFLGTTTKLLADAAPTNAVIHTIDLPKLDLPASLLPRSCGGAGTNLIGSKFRDDPEYEGRIVLHLCDLEHFDYSLYKGQIDFVFIDASHDYQDVLRDSRLALDILSPGGVIVWDDYQASTSGVVRALNELSTNRRLVHIAHTRLALYRG